MDEWTAIFAAQDVCVEPVFNVSEAVAHPQTQARQLIVDVPKPDGTTQRQTGHPIKFSTGEPVYKHTGATLGEHTVEIMREIGYHDNEIQALQADGILG